MGWVVADDGGQCACIEHLVRDDDGEIIGGIMRFYDHGPTYAWAYPGGRIGPIWPLKENGERATGVECDVAARRRVEADAGLSEIPRP